jgi:hypothetical protein
VAGVSVSFAVTAGGGSVGTPVVTDAGGIARTSGWTLGTKSETNALLASASGAGAVAFTATAVPGPAATIEKVAGDNQSAPLGSPVAIPPSVLVRD